MEELKLNNIYLIRSTTSDYQLDEIKVLFITPLSYKLKFNNNDNIVWYPKTKFNYNYEIFENITDIINDNKLNEFLTNTNEFILTEKKCGCCNGEGKVIDHSTTGLIKSDCSNCDSGNKKTFIIEVKK